jgi:hypothetical protein
MGRPPADGRDNRVACTPHELRDVVAAVARAIDGDLLRRKRLVLPDSWPEIRRVVCLLPDGTRRAALVALIEDEGRRIEGER